jgi:hypothetical protein
VSGVDELIDRWQAAWVGRQRGAFAALCAPDVHYEDPLCGEPLETPDALADHAARLWAAFPDARIERTGERLTDGRFVAAPFKLLGTHRGEIEGLGPTGRFLVVHVSAPSSTPTTPRCSSACSRRAARSASERCSCCAASVCAPAADANVSW